jgi:hypothetical protein
VEQQRLRNFLSSRRSDNLPLTGYLITVDG